MSNTEQASRFESLLRYERGAAKKLAEYETDCTDMVKSIVVELQRQLGCDNSQITYNLLDKGLDEDGGIAFSTTFTVGAVSTKHSWRVYRERKVWRLAQVIAPVKSVNGQPVPVPQQPMPHHLQEGLEQELVPVVSLIAESARTEIGRRYHEARW